MKKSKNSSNSSVDQKQSKTQIGMTSLKSPSTDSTTSGSTPPTGRFTGQTSTENIDNALITSFGQNLYDLVSIIIWCPKHKKLGLSRIGSNKGLFFPYKPLATEKSWFDTVYELCKEVLKVRTETNSAKKYLGFTPPVLVHLLRIQIPSYYTFICRILFSTELNNDSKHPQNCCENTKTIQWFSGEDLIGLRVRELWGPEPIVFAEAITTDRLNRVANYTEFTIKEVLKFSPKEPPKTYQEELVKAGGFDEKEILRLFGQFIQHTFPSQYMTLHSFDNFMTRVGLADMAQGLQTDMPSLFRAFAYTGANYLSFNELLLGLCAMDRNTAHGGHTGELRSSYVFRYYNRSQYHSQSSHRSLDFEDMKCLAKDILISKSKTGQQINDNQLEAELKSIYQSIGVQYKDNIEIKLFIRSIGEKRLRGTATLLRCMSSPLQKSRSNRCYESIQIKQINTSTAIDQKMQKVMATCMRCRQKKYTLAAHTVKLSKDGTIVDPQENRNQSDVQKMAKSLKRMSDQCFLGSTNANIILDNLRSFANSSAITQANNDSSSGGSSGGSSSNLWNQKSTRNQLVDRIMKICSEVEPIFRKEWRVLKVSSPVYVLGDIHGNFKDLMLYDRSIMKMGPTCSAANYLFLGDYVDRGENSIECILYLLSHKILSPDKYSLLRGNHELRSVQLMFTFKNECTEKFGKQLGNQLWEAFNKVFDSMPICAIIDESIFCAHGGIPTSSQKIEELMKIPVPLDDCESQSPVAWQMLWNDPVTSQEFRDYTQLLRSQQAGQGAQPNTQVPGFLPNTKRGTAFYFSDEALKKFLSLNQLSHVIRAHEVIPNGYAFHMGGKCITIFSSSKYCGGLNESACALVNDEKIRIIKLETN